MKTLFALSLVLSLCAFGGCQSLNHTQQIETACASASAAVKAITVANDAGKLTAAQQKQVISATAEVVPVCTAETVPTLDSVKQQAFLRAVVLLQGIAAR